MAKINDKHSRRGLTRVTAAICSCIHLTGFDRSAFRSAQRKARLLIKQHTWRMRAAVYVQATGECEVIPDCKMQNVCASVCYNK